MAAPAETPTDDQWHVRVGGEVKVLTLDQLDDLFRLEIIDSSTKVWQPGMPEWLPLSVVAGMEDAAPAEAAPLASAPRAEKPTGSSGLPPPPGVQSVAAPKTSPPPSQKIEPPPAASLKATLPFGPSPSNPPPAAVAAQRLTGAPPSGPFGRSPSAPPPPSSRGPGSSRGAGPPRPNGPDARAASPSPIAPRPNAPDASSALPPSLPPPPPPIAAASVAPGRAEPAPVVPASPVPALPSAVFVGSRAELDLTASVAVPPAMPSGMAPAVPSVPAPAVENLEPFVAAPARVKLGKAERSALTLLGVIGVLLTLYRNDLIGSVARAVGVESAYKSLSSALGGPSRDTPQGVRAFTASLPPLAPPESLKPRPTPVRASETRPLAEGAANHQAAPPRAAAKDDSKASTKGKQSKAGKAKAGKGK